MPQTNGAKRIAANGHKKTTNNTNNTNKTPDPKVETPKEEPELLHDRTGANGDLRDADFLTVFENLQRATPRNQNGFLLYFLDHQMIPDDFARRTPSQQTQFLEAANIPLTMLEGYLAFAESQPVWNQLPNEPDNYFGAFRHFLTTSHRNVEAAMQSLPPGFSAYTAKEAYVRFYWHERAKAYDILLPVAASRLREQRVMEMEDKHFMLGTKLLNKLGEEVNFRTNNDDDGRPFAGLKSKELIDAIIQATEVQRVALRMPAKGPRAPMPFEPTPGVGMERAIRDSAAHYSGASDGEISRADKMRKAVDEALAQSPEKAAALQELALDILTASRDNVDKSRQQQHTMNTENGETE